MSASAATKKKGQQPDEQEVLQVQQQAEDLQRQLNALNANLASNQNTLRKSKLTLKELDLLPESTPVYKAIGRIFLHASFQEIKTDLKEVAEGCEKNSDKLQNQKVYLEKELSDKIGQWRELTSK